MPRFFLDVINGHGEIPDEEGLELESQSAATAIALDSIRSMIAEDARRGVIDLTGRIVVRDEAHNELLTLPFGEAFQLKMPKNGSR